MSTTMYMVRADSLRAEPPRAYLEEEGEEVGQEAEEEEVEEEMEKGGGGGGGEGGGGGGGGERGGDRWRVNEGKLGRSIGYE